MVMAVLFGADVGGGGRVDGDVLSWRRTMGFADRPAPAFSVLFVLLLFFLGCSMKSFCFPVGRST